MSETDFDAIVVGAGIVGAVSAFTLSERGYRVALVEAHALGRGTSDNSFAWVNATSKTANEPYHRLNAAGADGYRTYAQRWGERAIGLHPSGMVQWVRNDNVADAAQLQARRETLAGFGYPVSPLSRADLVRMEPHVAFEANVEGLYALADAWLDAPTFIAFIAERLRENGGRIFDNCRALELMLDGNGAV
ncbi:MAG: FAD-binding oxidoreductase, partial [Gammaproteobacteria bacterium]|nr:FAD-binding oxidoreductase [Gammaproteobacteria bacterium]